jgi:hypothetical protein
MEESSIPSSVAGFPIVRAPTIALYIVVGYLVGRLEIA